MPTARAQSDGRRRAARFLIALGPEAAAEVFKVLGDDEVATLSSAVAEMGVISAAERRQVLEEFVRLAEESRWSATGGTGYARQALSRTYGDERAGEILERVRRGEGSVTSFEDLERLDPIVVRDFLRGEHPQTVAVVLAHLSHEQAGAVVATLDGEVRGQVLARLAQLGRVQREMVSEIQTSLRARLAKRPDTGPPVDGPRLVARILNNTDKDVEDAALNQIGREDPQLVEVIQRQLFLFEDLVLLDGRSIQKVLRGVDAKTLSIAMKAAPEDVQQVIFGNMSKRAAGVLQSELEVLGPMPVTEVEKAQREIIDTVRTLEREGEIVVPRGAADAMV